MAVRVEQKQCIPGLFKESLCQPFQMIVIHGKNLPFHLSNPKRHFLSFDRFLVARSRLQPYTSLQALRTRCRHRKIEPGGKRPPCRSRSLFCRKVRSRERKSRFELFLFSSDAIRNANYAQPARWSASDTARFSFARTKCLSMISRARTGRSSTIVKSWGTLKFEMKTT